SAVADAFGNLCDRLDVPVIAKETGAGISDRVARQLADLGAKMVNVSGAGGTSWSKVEYARQGFVQGFGEWGIPTAVSIMMCSKILPTIASGGVRSGIDIAKSMALGARLGASASPFLKAKDPSLLIKDWAKQVRTVMFLTSCKNLSELANARLVFSGNVSKYMFCMGIDHYKYSQR
ncbi:type 2 isopentenyl-diphosphate Delta-isomerase, partial [Candidatus Parvarchaeota archaeon]|nr:type 2 isopentenyl-diphosphate Delta-isomerase [Candidatus Parvarchaeota archaeon]